MYGLYPVSAHMLRIAHPHLLNKKLQRYFLFGMPLSLDLVRHGQSEGNLLNDALRDGRAISAEIMELLLGRHASCYRLTDKGRWQARSAGDWLKRDILARGFDPATYYHRRITSSHIRAMETSLELSDAMGCPELIWLEDLWRTERAYGEFEFAKLRLDQLEKYRQFKEHQASNPLHVAPPGGESLLMMGPRACRDKYDTLARECSLCNVLIVSHGEVMWMDRFYLERLTEETFRELDRSKKPKDRIHNCMILRYTRQDPETGEISTSFSHTARICPWNEEFSTPWTRIVRPKLTRAEMRRRVDAEPLYLAA